MNTDTPTPRTDKCLTFDSIAICETLERELAAVTEQRDRLAEAIRKYTGGCYPESFLLKTLRSLNPK